MTKTPLFAALASTLIISACNPVEVLRTLGAPLPPDPRQDFDEFDEFDEFDDEETEPGVVFELETVDYDALLSICDAEEEFEIPPGLLPLPEAGELPSWCDETRERNAFVAACGEPTVVQVAPGANAINAALRGCGGSCHLQLEAGVFAGVSLPRCTILEGAGPGTIIAGQTQATGGDTIIARLQMHDAYAALYAERDPLINEAVIAGGYEGAGASWSATGFRVCRSQVTGGYAGLGLSWESTSLKVAGSSVAACYEGIGGSWGSSDIEVTGSKVFGGYSGVGTSWGTVGVTVTDNELASGVSAVDIHIAGNFDDNGNEVVPESFDVLVSGNTVIAGRLPSSRADLGIVVEDNE